MIRELGTATLGWCWMGVRVGVLHVLLPLPLPHDGALAAAGLREFAGIDARWEHEFERLVERLVHAIEARAPGPFEVLAPRTSARPHWVERLVHFVSFRPTFDPLHPARQGPAAALLAAARAPGQRFAALRSADADVHARDGRPLLWVWLSNDLAPSWDALVVAAAGNLPTKSLTLSIDALAPHSRRELVSIDVYANEVLWTDGSGVLGFRGEFLLPHPGNLGMPDPRRVFVAPADEWPTSAPRWADHARPAIVAALGEQGWHVIESPGAIVHERQTPRIS